MSQAPQTTAVLLPQILVVLARPSEPRNIGATCRAIKNFGIHRLLVVTDREIDYGAARPLATGADDILNDATVVSSLREAVAECSLVAGITRRTGQKRKHVSYSPWEFAARASGRYTRPGEVAIVFGNERSGLSDEELEECHVAVSIPTSPECPSLNLSHAVELIAYELYKEALGRVEQMTTTGATERQDRPARLTAAEIEQHADSIIDSLERLRFHTQAGPQGMRTLMRDLIARATLSPAEALRFEKLFEKLAGMHGARQ